MVFVTYVDKTQNYNYSFATKLGLQTSEFSKINHWLKKNTKNIIELQDKIRIT